MKLLDRIKRKWALLFSSPEEYARKIGVKIGQGCYISTKRFPSEAYLIEIGNYVRIAPETAFFTHGGIWALRKKYNNPDSNISEVHMCFFGVCKACLKSSS